MNVYNGWRIDYDKLQKELKQAEQRKSEQSGQSVNDPVNHPSHYTRGGIECIDAITAAVTDLNGPEAWLTGSTIKYIWRWRWKNGLEDLRKAQFYLTRLIARVEAEQSVSKGTDTEKTEVINEQTDAERGE